MYILYTKMSLPKNKNYILIELKVIPEILIHKWRHSNVMKTLNHIT